jgi:hypothetical protein
VVLSHGEEHDQPIASVHEMKVAVIEDDVEEAGEVEAIEQGSGDTDDTDKESED